MQTKRIVKAVEVESKPAVKPKTWNKLANLPLGELCVVEPVSRILATLWFSEFSYNFNETLASGKGKSALEEWQGFDWAVCISVVHTKFKSL